MEVLKETSLRGLLKEKNCSINHLAAQINTISRPVLLKYIDDPERFTHLTLKEIASVLEMDIEIFLMTLGLICK